MPYQSISSTCTLPSPLSIVEEELKRLNEEVGGGTYGAVNFNYDYSAQPAQEVTTQIKEEGVITGLQYKNCT